jgi:carboxymethylenebutenolidase
MLHYGEKDPMIPMLNVRAIEKAQPQLPVYVYPAGHGFNCDERRDYDPEAARFAEERTFKFLAENGI